MFMMLLLPELLVAIYHCMMIEDQFLQTRITIVTTQQCLRTLNGSGVNNEWTVSGTCCIKSGSVHHQECCHLKGIAD